MFEAIVKRGTLMTVILSILCIIGVAAAVRIPVQMIPDMEVRTIMVLTTWPGATPQDVEREIVLEQEEFLSTIPGMERLVSSVSAGQAMIELEFPHDVDLTETLIRVNNALSQVPSYPLNVDQPRVDATSFSDQAFMYFRLAPLPGNPRALDMNMMGDFLDRNVRRRLERVAGVSQAEISGPARQVQILLDAGRLAERRLSLTDVRNAITARNRDVSGGDLESGKRSYLLRTVGRYEDVDDIGATILSRDEEAIVRLSDVATVRLAHYEPGEILLYEGRPARLLSLRRESGANVIAVSRAVREEMAAINADVLDPAGLQMTLITDDSGYVEASVRNVWTNLGLGAALATLVMFLFLRSGRATLIGVIGIPICTIAAFLGLLLAGRTINVISLAGVAFAIGMTLDNSIVVLESIDMARRRGLDRFRAAIEGVRDVWPAVVASTLTTILVFLPILFIEQEAGQLYSDVALAISGSILASMLVSVTLVPTLGARLMPRQTPQVPAGQFVSEDRAGVYGWITRAVESLTATTARRLACMLGSAGLSAWILFALTPPAEYLPEGEEARIFAIMSAPAGYNLSRMEEIALEIEQELTPYLDASPDAYSRGEAEIPAIGRLIITAHSQSVWMMATTKAPGHIDALTRKVTEIYENYPGMSAFATRGSIITSNDGGTRSVNVDVSGPDLETIYAVASTVFRRAGDVFEDPMIQSDPATLSLSQPMIEIRPDWARAAEIGFSAEEIGFSVAALTDGAFVDEFYSDDRKIDMFVFSDAGQSADPDGLGQLQLFTPEGSIIPLSSIAEVAERVDTNAIRRVNGSRTVTLNIIPPRSVPLERGVAIVEEDVIAQMRAAGEIPASVTLDISGAADQLDATRGALLQNYAVAILIVYLLLVAIFVHWGYPLLVMATIPLGFAGGIVGLTLLNAGGALLPALGLPAISQSFDMISMLGFLILMGTVVNNPILVVHRAMENMKIAGADPRRAVAEAVASRLRPMLMSSVTTIVGLLPLVLVPGAGSELYRGVGAIVLFGILGMIVVTLTFLPSLTVTVLQLAKRGKQLAPEEAAG
ncbi:AcrB/AcrD/AcrF family protein [Hyphomonas neptunium ATCC 15444]|uniref:AcrB/AcrD/AcrF family protein n=2 Tax=Hyphomonas TaxID=85 RepID=Q0C057_HYPNA|nr:MULTISPECIES: efflux RND transporter permease subunit [Hyphomonas]ABI76021.1 AcrB/AcrD/AcrF family protein [Hyphomonas neptunium ATCC 15444]KCZ90531.1 AcrB/AcrD/AcrF family protein [Hyphomonas hirschiana VP5]